MKLTDASTGFLLYDSGDNPFKAPLADATPVSKALETAILSASGWRKVFAKSGNEEDTAPEIRTEDAYFLAAAAEIQADYLKKKEKHPSVLVGIDARPTGPALAAAAIRGFLASGVAVRYLFIAAAPEIMAENARGENGCSGFFYISASHNPVGHNGVKFGGDGGVYPGTVTGPFAEEIAKRLSDASYLEGLRSRILSLDEKDVEAVFRSSSAAKAEALATYRAFVLETAETDAASIRKNLEKSPLGVVAEFNGSARALSIDQAFLPEIGVKLTSLNSKPRQIVHAIVPEGENLVPCMRALEEAHAKDPSCLLGYVPDNDGDRGNIAVIDEENGGAFIPAAQDVFALAAMATLGEMKVLHPEAKLAIAVNGPTSLRIDRIAEAFGARVFRSEVGEANVVSLATIAREKGFLVKMCGEGSNGGNITDPAKVRDPMNTILTLLKLKSDRRILAAWCKATGRRMPEKITLSGALRLLPVFTTTGAFSPQGKMHVTRDARTLKNNYEKLFAEGWKAKQKELERYGITGYTVWQAAGTVTERGMGEQHRRPPYKGGWKACFTDGSGREVAFIWMRPSGTEPIFRVLCDVEGDNKGLHDDLLSWHRGLVAAADR